MIRRQPSGAQNRRTARARAEALAADGQREPKLLVRAADCEPLILTGDLSDDDLATGGRLSVALAELLPDMVRHYAARLEDSHGEPATLYRLELPGSRTALAEATPADLELARHYLRDQALERPLRTLVGRTGHPPFYPILCRFFR